ncbi:sensor histidine kinase [Actinoplanes rectilineatus]|uniref:sensor histidine kinase n=1 Tax=Actinoplanes rectilineatus TaxID=113571 RepID=UPI0005F2F067|nr:HAMP domain-containing sensor histidine kinase [Actinoplanes rectilineatus]
MPERPDYPTLIRGQIAVLDRITTGAPGLSVLQQIVRLAEETLGARGACFVEFDEGHGRIIAASGVCEPSIGLRVDPLPLETADAVVATTGAGSLHAFFGDGGPPGNVGDGRPPGDGGPPREFSNDGGTLGDGGTPGNLGDGGTLGDFGDEHQAVLAVLAGLVDRVYDLRSGLPAHPEPARHQADRDLWVAVTSHELRTPVTVIKGYADTLTNHWDTLGEPGRREAVRVIGARAGELARLVDRLLSAASEDGSVGSSPAGPFDLTEALREAAGELPSDLRQRILFGELPSGLPKAYGNRDSIATILTELATNAGKYSADGSTVEICAGTDDDTLRFRVSDRGVGIPPEHVERAFERYWQGDTGDRQHHPGAGLGLYLVRRLVERQQGWVSLRPREGGGTVAEVRLPRA